jgi:hypothetical protein
MRLSLVAALAVTAFVATMAIQTTDANAVVYCRTVGVPKGCIARPVAHPNVVYCKRVGYPKGCVVR